jgi:hypothetical protein
MYMKPVIFNLIIILEYAEKVAGGLLVATDEKYITAAIDQNKGILLI